MAAGAPSSAGAFRARPPARASTRASSTSRASASPPVTASAYSASRSAASAGASIAGCSNSKPRAAGSASAAPATTAGSRYNICQARSPPIGAPSCTSPGLTVMTWPGPASTWPRPLCDTCAPWRITPMPYWSCVCRAKARPLRAATACTPARALRDMTNWLAGMAGLRVGGGIRSARRG